MFSGSQQFNENEDEEKDNQIFNYNFLWSNVCYFCTDDSVDAQSEPGVMMNGFTENRLHPKFKGCFELLQ